VASQEAQRAQVVQADAEVVREKELGGQGEQTVLFEY